MTVENLGTQPWAGTIDILIKTLRTLGQKGYPDAANRLAAQAWLALRDERPREAERINGAMHYLARLTPEPGAAPIGSPTTQEKI